MKKIFCFIAATLLFFLSLAGCVDTPSIETAVLSFVFRAADNPALSEDVTADLSGTSITALCPAGTDLTALVPAVTVSEGASVYPAGGTAQDFSGPVVYRVTAADGESYTDYTVSVSAGAFTLRSSVSRLKSWFWYADPGTDELTLSIFEKDGLACSWTAAIDVSWASLDSVSGNLTGSAAALTCTIDSAGLTSGTHSGTAVFSTGAGQNLTVNLTAVVAEPVQHVIDTGLGNPTIISAADIDGDGDTDITASGWGTMLYKNDGSGGFGTEVTVQAGASSAGDRMRITDIDGDSELDIINNSSVGISPEYTLIWYRNDGEENFIQNNIASLNYCRGMETGDFDGDGLTDVIAHRSIGGGSFRNTLWINGLDEASPGWAAEDYGFTNSSTFHWSADMDGDGDLDLAFISLYSPYIISWYENDGASPPGFTGNTVINTADYISSITLLDFDGDGDTDIAAAVNGGLQIFENNGAAEPAFAVPSDPAASGLPAICRLNAGDINSDGQDDVIVASADSDTVVICLSTGETAPGWPVYTVTTGFDAGEVIALDADCDGDTDLAGVSTDDELVVWWEL